MSSLTCLDCVVSKYFQSHKARVLEDQVANFKSIDEEEFSRLVLSSVVYILVVFWILFIEHDPYMYVSV